MVKSNIAIILARGGAKRLPGKNILPLGGQPMVFWTIKAALESDCFDRVLLSTDDEKIASVGREAGAQVPFLRNEGADDHTPSSEATLIALYQAENYWKEEYSIVAQLMANCPLRNAIDIRNSVDAFKKKKAPSQISSFQFGWMNPWWAARLSDDGVPEWLFPEAKTKRSQDLSTLYCPTGAIWLAKCDKLKLEKNFYLDGHTFFPLDWMSAIDIDDGDDLKMARACMAMRLGEKYEE